MGECEKSLYMTHIFVIITVPSMKTIPPLEGKYEADPISSAGERQTD